MTGSVQSKEFSVCGGCGQKSCRECFPWPDEEPVEMTALREELALAQEESAGKDSFINSQTEEINRLRLFALENQHEQPENEEVLMKAEIGVLRNHIAELGRAAGVAEQRIQILVDGHAQMKEILDERESEIVRLKEIEFMYESVSK